jgi:hypothetical protein
MLSTIQSLQCLAQLAEARKVLENHTEEVESDHQSEGISQEDSLSCDNVSIPEESQESIRALSTLLVRSPYTFDAYEILITYSNGKSLYRESDVEYDWVPKQPVVEREKPKKRVSNKSDHPLCDHVKQWKRLRHKKGYTHFYCVECGTKWRKLTGKPE